MAEVGFDAFISYRRSDGRSIAGWLRRELQGYRPPNTLKDLQGRRLRLYIDTAYERGATDFYEQTIRPALLASKWLIVVATPDAVQRREIATDWIAREIADFASGPNGANILIVRGAGDLNGLLPGDLDQRYAHPEIIDLRGAGPFWFFNPALASRLADEKLKLAGPLLEVAPQDMPLLRREEERLAQRRLGSAAGLAGAVVSLVTGALLLVFIARQQAQTTLESSLYASGKMIAMVANGVDRNAGEVRSGLMTQGCDLLDMLRSAAKSDPPSEGRMYCAAERAIRLAELKDVSGSLQGAGDSLDIGRRLVESGMRDESGAGENLMALYETLVPALSAGLALEQKEQLLKAWEQDAAMLKARFPEESRFMLAAAEAHGQMSDLLATARRWPERLKALESAEASLASAAPKIEQKRLAWLAQWRARLRRLAAETLWAIGQRDHAVARMRTITAEPAPDAKDMGGRLERLHARSVLWWMNPDGADPNRATEKQRILEEALGLRAAQGDRDQAALRRIVELVNGN